MSYMTDLGFNFPIDLLEGIFEGIFINRMKGAVDRFRFSEFKSSLKSNIEEYIKEHDGTVLTTSDIQKLIIDHNLLEKLFLQITDQKVAKSKSGFINDQIEFFHSIRSCPESFRHDADEILKKFIEYLYDSIYSFYTQQLSTAEKVMLAQQKEQISQISDQLNAREKTFLDAQIKGIDEVKQILQGSALLNPDQIWDIYQTLSTMILNGQTEPVRSLLCLLKDKNKDLEYGISLLLSMYATNTDNQNFSLSPNKIVNGIVDNRIYDDVCRKVVILDYLFGNTTKLLNISDRNPHIQKIIQELFEKKSNNLYKTINNKPSKRAEIEITTSVYYPNELWLANRLCLINLLTLPCTMHQEAFSDLIGEPKCLIDELIYLESWFYDLSYSLGCDFGEVKALYEKVNNLCEKCEKMSFEIQKKAHLLQLKIAKTISYDEVLQISDSLSLELLSDLDIKLLVINAQSMNGRCEFQDLISICMKVDDYWPLSEYLMQQISKDPFASKTIIDRHLFLIDKDLRLFLIYIKSIKETGDLEKAIELLRTYEDKYNDYLDYWIERLDINYSDDCLVKLIDDYSNESYLCLHPQTLYQYIRLLIKHNKYIPALKEIDRIELLAAKTPELHRLKGLALSFSGKELEALSIFTNLFKSGFHDEEIIFYILALSIKNKRAVDPSILSIGENSTNSSILLHTSAIYIENGELDRAYKIILYALMRTTDNQSSFFNILINLLIIQNYHGDTHSMITRTNVDTVITLIEEKGSNEVKVAIHSGSYLPKEPYTWENTIHIYKEKAIKYGLFRRKKDDLCQFEGKTYRIQDITSLDSFLVAICFKKLESMNEAKPYTINFNDSNKKSLHQLAADLKSHFGDSNDNDQWLNDYQILNEIPQSFFVSNTHWNCAYFQLVSIIITNPKSFYRDGISSSKSNADQFIFTYAALVVLQKLEWKQPKSTSKYNIAESLKNKITADIDSVISKNNNDFISSLGIFQDRLVLIESTEDEKVNSMKEATNFGFYCKDFSIIRNDCDLQGSDEYLSKIKTAIGIADYDSLVLAQRQHMTLVTAEIATSIIAQNVCPPIQTINIASFLSQNSTNPRELLEYIKRMREFRFVPLFTTDLIDRIDNYFINSNEEEQMYILDELKNILNSSEPDIAYEELLESNIREIMRDKLEHERALTIIDHVLLSRFLTVYTNEKGMFEASWKSEESEINH